MNVPKPGYSHSDKPHGIIGIGASAGSLTALRNLLRNPSVPRDLAYIIVTHLPPDKESHLAEILQKEGQLTVVSVSKVTLLQPGHVYVLPPGKNLEVTETHVYPRELEQQRKDRAPVNHLFKSLAQTYGPKCAGIILTGVGSDGTLGLKEIKAYGGLVIVQDTVDAEFDGMPVSAINSGVVDIILSLPEIADYLSHIRNIFSDNAIYESFKDPAIEKVIRQVRLQSGRNLGILDNEILGRHITWRMQIARARDIAHYLELLQNNPTELPALVDSILVNVNTFFRQKERFQYLKSELAPRLLQSKDPIRIWSVGCSTGEEAYSFAMILLEEASRLDVSPNIKIYATDLHGPSLEKAREGRFEKEIENEISEERLHRFFEKEGEAYRISHEIRDMVEFSHYNYLVGPPVEDVSVITCTGVFEKLAEQTATELLDIFYFALNEGGRLLVDNETYTARNRFFLREEKMVAVYQKRAENPLSIETDDYHVSWWHRGATMGPLFYYLNEGMCLIKMIFDGDGNPIDYLFLEVNPAFEKQTGLTDVEGKTMRELAPDHEEHWFQVYGRIAKSGKAERFEDKAQQLGQRWYEVQAFPVGMKGSDLVGVVFKDISMRKQAEEALKESEGRYHNLFVAMEEGFCVMDIMFDEDNNPYDYRFLEVNPAFAKHTGLIDAVGKTALELVPDLEQYWIDTYGNIALTGKREEFIQGSDAMGKWFEVEAFRIGEEGSTNVALLFTDVTQRIKIEKALRESEERFRTFADTAPATLWVTNAKGECTFISQGWTDITGMSQPDALMYGWLEAVHPDDFEGIKAAFLEHNRLERPFRLEYRLKLKNDTYHWVIDAGKPHWDKEGQFLGYVGSIIDIDDRKKVEEALRKNEAFVNTTLEQLPVGVSVCNAPDGELLFQNKAAKHIMGHDMINTDNISGYSRYHAIHSDGTPYKASDYPLVKAIKGKVTRQEEMLYRKGDGSLITLIVNSSPIRDENNKIIRAVTAFHDITELRRAQEAVMLSEAHLKLILESATDYAIFTMDLDLRITDWNSGAEQILGFCKDEVIGKEGSIIHVPEENEDELFRKAEVAREKGKVESEGWYRKKDGTRFYGRGTIMPLRVEGEEIL